MKLRPKKSEFIYSVPTVALMRDFGDEIAFIGRSNAGKSSLINAICDNDLARTSKTPGRTRHAVVYNLVLATDDDDKSVTLVDLPGFGFALMSKKEAKECEALIFSYLEKRRPLRAVILLLDIRRDLDEREERIVEIAKARDITVHLVLTKSDKIAVSKRRPVKNKVAAALTLSVDAIHLHSKDDERTTKALMKAIFAE